MAIILKNSTRIWLRRAYPRTPAQTTKRHSSNSPTPKNDPTTTAGTSIPVPNTVATLPLWQRLGPLTRGLQAYGRSQRKRPYATQFCSSLVIYFLGDLSAQSISGEDYDPKRTLRALVIGAGSSIPSYKWFMFLGNHFNYRSAALSLATKVTVNQLAFTPIFNSYFFGMQALLSGDSLPEVWDRIRRTVPISFVNSCKLWPAVTAFSFTFIDPHYRSIFAGFVAIGWQTYLSYLNRMAEEAEALVRSGASGGRIERKSAKMRIEQKAEA
ncbi:Mpv17/PMP22 family protein [Phlyctema vagabunda]|uniref:Mpv17/PMP22 family protein n=1 Tax=Phlyctema vagabunda TaxID=108571 RepID=A0ABR4PWG2_9HELO